MKTKAPVLAGLLSLAARTGKADPTWPAPIDHMEEIVYQLQGFKGSLFNDIITPCNNEAAGPGRITASEWLRVGFHDMSPHNRFFSGGTDGLDASLQFELNNGENTGPGHKTTLEFFANYLSSRSSMADLIAAGVYASVRSCGGPVIPLRLGRKDATRAGGGGVPQPQNSAFTFRSQFDRMGFTQTEMIQLVACGHTLGSVHSTEFPQIVPAEIGHIPFDSSRAGFDNKVVTEYVARNTTNPLVSKAAADAGRNSDFKVFNSDGNATINTLTDPTVFSNTCRTVLQKMIDVVPAGVTLTDPIAPYAVKPVDMQLTLNSDGTFSLTGYIRVRTTALPADSIKNVVLTWKDRNGGNSCGSSVTCSTTATLQGVSAGFDDTFGFFPIQATIPASSGISSFTLALNLNDGSSQSYDNNGNSYPMSDAVVLQKPQSCLLQGSGALTVSALVRNDLVDLPVNLLVSYLVPRNTADGNPVPALTESTIPMAKGDCVGQYTFYSASFTIPGGLSHNARISVAAGSNANAYTDAFNKASDLSGTCGTFTGGTTCSDVTTSSVITSTTSVPPSSSTSVPATTTSSSSSTGSPTPAVKPTVGGYVFVSCWTEGSGVRALTGAAYAYDEMTLESCMANCTGFDYWGTEYGRECYCGNSLAASSTEAAVEECNMVCGGDPTEFCGAGNRLELYSTTATRTSTATSTATATATSGPAIKPTVGAYTRVGCQTEATAGRALSAKEVFANDDMTLESCAAYCEGFTYFGAEYGRECYCGNNLNAGSVPAPDSECNMLCAGDALEYCGAGNRLELYRLSTVSLSTTEVVTSTTSTTSASATATLSRNPIVSPYSFVGCWTEGTGVRALSAKTYASGTDMTLESCAAFCAGYKYFGTEYSAECYCGNTLDASSSEAPSVDECSMTCSGNPLQYCGGPNRLELYETDTVSNPGGGGGGGETPGQPTQPETVEGGWTFYKCMTEANGARALDAKTWADDTMTLEGCASFCEDYEYFGAEYGRECYCGNSFAEGAVEAPASECSMPCAGDGEQLCGNGNRLSVYSKTA
ncbi:heme peroxidase [Parathielavia appendiculata]|uniref:Heme peroxidase n=1 Tax=Parathielavia appendiculata TaxID=2587402 RepID=A0AAN6Z7E0_9PEZI|nr:heme peroxidase [Parathielavia appendiculata]